MVKQPAFQVRAGLIRRLSARDARSLGALGVVDFDGGVVVLGEEQHLPWVDGGVYLGVEPEATARVMSGQSVESRAAASRGKRAVLRTPTSRGGGLDWGLGLGFRV